jgi:hypothetical protein
MVHSQLPARPSETETALHGLRGRGWVYRMRLETEKIIHLLKPKEFRVWCCPNLAPKNFNVTISAPKATCCNCITKYRQSRKKYGERGTGRFKQQWTNRKQQTEIEKNYDGLNEW